jgi:tetratricopeptide (TPR) repeat protein
VVDVQLVDARNGIIAWGDRFTAKAADIPRIQQLIATRIAASLRISMHEAEKHAILERAPQDLGVYERTLRGASKHQFNPQAARAAREDLEEAIRLDPNYALAWGYLAWINLTDLWVQLTGEWHFSRIDEVISQFRRAIELDPSRARAYGGLGQAMRTKGDLAQALALSQRAVQLGPSDPDNLLFHAVNLFETGDLSEATKVVEKALELHPLRPSYYSYFHAMILWGNKRFQEALDEADECLRQAPRFWPAEVYRALALVGLGRLSEAKAQIALSTSPVLGFHPPPQSPQLASRFLADLKAAGWRPSVATERVAV